MNSLQTVNLWGRNNYIKNQSILVKIQILIILLMLFSLTPVFYNLLVINQFWKKFITITHKKMNKNNVIGNYLDLNLPN